MNKLGVTCKAVLATAVILLLVCGSFVAGFDTCRHLKTSIPNSIRSRYLTEPGDAPPAVRSGVLAALRDFHEGYVRRNPAELGPFMERLFSRDDVLLIGTDTGEWARGYPAVSEFIRGDWRQWGRSQVSGGGRNGLARLAT